MQIQKNSSKNMLESPSALGEPWNTKLDFELYTSYINITKNHLKLPTSLCLNTKMCLETRQLAPAGNLSYTPYKMGPSQV